MYFARAELLHLLWAIPLVAALFAWAFVRRRRRIRLFVSAQILPELTREYSYARSVFRYCLTLGFLFFSVLALARPQWGARLETVRRKGVDVIMAVDTSFSMSAEDLVPSRLAVARQAVRGLLSRLQGDRAGLVAFAGSAVVQCPLTLDYGAMSLFLDSINVGMLQEPGTSLAAAIETSNSAFIAKETRYKVLVLFTDGEDLGGQIESAVEKARSSGVVIYAVGTGTQEGRPVPVRDEKGDIVEYRRDESGQVVISRLDESALVRIAVSTGGRYFRATTGGPELDELAEDISRQDKKELESKLFQNYEERFQYPLAAAVLCLVWSLWVTERRDPERTSLLERLARRGGKRT
jgi:Ca-activated chloride channel homolog